MDLDSAAVTQPLEIRIDEGEVRIPRNARPYIRAVRILSLLVLVGAWFHGTAWIGFVAAWVGALVPVFLTRRRDVQRGAVIIGPRGVTLGGNSVVARGSITGGDVRVARDGKVVVHLERGESPALELVARDDAEGRAALAALGLATQNALRFGAGMSWRNGLAVVAGMFLLCAAWIHGLELGSFSAVVVAEMLLSAMVLGGGAAWRPTSVVVAADGVMLSNGLGRRRWLAMHRVHDLHIEGDELRLRIEDKHLVVKIKQDHAADEATGTFEHRCATLATRLSEIVGSHARQNAPSTPFTLPPVAANIDEDVQILRRTRERGYREIPVTREALWTLVEDPSASPRSRARAAVALRVSTEEAPRLRVAAAGTANPELSELLDAAACGDEAELKRQLAKLGPGS